MQHKGHCIVKGLLEYWILNVVKPVSVVFVYTKCWVLDTCIYTAVCSINFEFRFKILSSLETQQPLSFFLPPDRNFTFPHPLYFSWPLSPCHSLIFAVITQTAVVHILTGFFLCIPSQVLASLCVKIRMFVYKLKNHFSFKNEWRTRR